MAKQVMVKQVTLEQVAVTLDQVATQIAGIADRLDGLETKVDGLETKVDGLETKVDQVLEWQNQHDERFSHLMAHLVKEGIHATK